MKITYGSILIVNHGRMMTMTEEEKRNWGGARANCGRKAGRTKKQFNFYCSESERDYLKQCLKEYRAEQKKGK